MRLSNIAPACALSILLLSVPLTLASGDPSATIVNTAGSTLAKDGAVLVSYAGLNSGFLGAELRAEGDLVATFAGSGNGTGSLVLRLNASSHASGSFAFVATVWDEAGHVATSAPVDFALHDAPRLSVSSAAYVWSERAALVQGSVLDADASVPAVLVSVGQAEAWAVPAEDGTWSTWVSMNASAGKPYAGAAFANASDGLSASVAFSFRPDNRPGEISVLSALYETGGHLRVVLEFSDPDGVRAVSVRTPVGGQDFFFPGIGGGRIEPAIPVSPRVGDYNGTATVMDEFGQNVSTSFSFSIRPVHRVLFDQTTQTQLGAAVDSSSLLIPPNAGVQVKICTRADCGGGVTAAAAAVHDMNGTLLCAGTGGSKSCDLGVLAPQSIRIERAQGPSTYLEVRVEADVL